MPQAAVPIAGAVVGGLMSDGPESQQTTVDKSPWKEAEPWIKDNIGTGQRLQQYYQQNPFNPIQQNAIQQTLSDQSHYRNSMLPGLMDFANQMMGSNYSRQPGNPFIPQQAQQAGLMRHQGPQQSMDSTRPMQADAGPSMDSARPEQMSPLAGQLGDLARQLPSFSPSQFGPMAGAMQQAPMAQQAGMQGMFSAPQGVGSCQVDWAGLNPFSPQNTPQKPAQAGPSDLDSFRQMMGQAMFADTSPQQSAWEDDINPAERWMRQQLGRPDNRMMRYSGG